MINRRQAIRRAAQAGALCALSSTLSVPCAIAEPTSPAKSKLTVGLATFGFTDLTNAELATELSSAGVHTIQLFLSQKDSAFWRYNERNDVSSLTPERCQAIAGTYHAAGIRIHSIGVYTNLVHPDAAERRANLAFFKAMFEVGRQMGVHTFITEAGHYQHPTAPEPSVPYHFRDTLWPQTVTTVRELAKMAEDAGATVLFEPFYRGFLASAKRTRLLLEEVNSRHIRALLDPANLIEINDLEEMFQQLGPWIDCLHAKDRKLHIEAGVAAGAGSLDYVKLVALVAAHTPKAPLILEYVGQRDYRQALGHLRKALAQAGIEEAGAKEGA